MTTTDDNRRADPAMPAVIASLAIACGIVLPACGSQSLANAPPAIADACRREVAELTGPAVLPPVDETSRHEQGLTDTPIDEARAARAEQKGASLAGWPEEALLYRCLASRGVVLTEQQAATLAEWQARMDDGSSVPADDID